MGKHGFALRLYTRASEEGGPYRDLNCFLVQGCVGSDHDFVWAGLALVVKCQMYKIKQKILARECDPRWSTPLVQICNVYRGIPASYIDSQLNVKMKFFWPNLVSTSLSKEIAKKFAGKGGFIFDIRLNNNCVAINVDEISHYGENFDVQQTDTTKVMPKSREMEAILEPYGAFKVISNHIRDGYRWICLEIVDSNSVQSCNYGREIEETDDAYEVMGQGCTIL